MLRRLTASILALPADHPQRWLVGAWGLLAVGLSWTAIGLEAWWLAGVPVALLVVWLAVVAAFAAHEEHARWREVDAPVDGAVVLLAKRNRDAHAGTYVALDEGLIMHCDRPHGVVAERPLELQARCWGRLRYFVPL